MKKAIAREQVSHVNTGTGVPRDELAWPRTNGRVMRLRSLHVEVDSRSTVTPFGGLALAVDFVRRFRVAQRIDAHLHLLKLNLPYYESDHVLAQAFSLYVGGTCLEDVAHLQHDEATRRMLGACRLPDPTTAGDFLRRFDDDVPLQQLRAAIDEVQDAVWRKLPRRRRQWATIDLDGKVKELYGVQKEGADFSYSGKWSYHPLMASLAETGECLASRNRPGNMRSSEGAADLVDEIMPRVKARFATVLVRGDSDFDRTDLRQVVEKHGAYFAFVARETGVRPTLANGLDESAWRPYANPKHRPQEAKGPRRRTGKNQRRQQARKRGYHDIRQVKQWVTEIPWTPKGSDVSYRLVIRRQRVEECKGQQVLFQSYRFHYVLTNLPAAYSPHEVIDVTYQRCDQENLIEQMGSGLAMWRMPVAEFHGNSAWLEIGRLAWNLAKWIAMLALAPEVIRWEWKRFRLAFVYLAAEVITRARQTWIRFPRSHRFVGTLLRAKAVLSP